MIKKAFLLANKLHGDQIRKDGNPYIVHPTMVAMELAKNGADDNLICAGLLHDVMEDAHLPKEVLTMEFNEDIANLVANDSEDKSLDWEVRKEIVINDVKARDNRYKMLVCADKLANLKDVYEDTKVNGDRIWERFKRGKAQQKWFYDKLLEALEDIKDKQMYKDLKECMDKVFGEDQ